MFSKAILIASAAAVTAVAVPATAEASHRRYYNNGYSQPYYGQQAYGYGYQQPYQQGYYGQQRYYDQGYYGQQRGYAHRRQRCGKGTTGLIVGGAAGALLGREIERGTSRNRYYGNRSGGTTGAIIGGALGALAGRGIARSC